MKTERGASGYILSVGILALLIVGAIVAYQVYAALVKSQISEEQVVAIKPIDGGISIEVIEELRERRKFSRTELNVPLKVEIEIETEDEGSRAIEGVDLETLEATMEATQTGTVE